MRAKEGQTALREFFDGADIEITCDAAFAVAVVVGFVGGIIRGVAGCWILTLL